MSNGVGSRNRPADCGRGTVASEASAPKPSWEGHRCFGGFSPEAPMPPSDKHPLPAITPERHISSAHLDLAKAGIHPLFRCRDESAQDGVLMQVVHLCSQHLIWTLSIFGCLRRTVQGLSDVLWRRREFSAGHSCRRHAENSRTRRRALKPRRGEIRKPRAKPWEREEAIVSPERATYDGLHLGRIAAFHRLSRFSLYLALSGLGVPSPASQGVALGCHLMPLTGRTAVTTAADRVGHRCSLPFPARMDKV